ncbi:MAG: multiheme c-type cytochrome, partial [Planctomycetota bacterium]
MERKTKIRWAGLAAAVLLVTGAGWWYWSRPHPSYDPEADPERLASWAEEYRSRSDWLTHPALEETEAESAIAGEYYFSRYNYQISVRSDGEVVLLTAHGLDKQVGGGAWWTVGRGELEGKRARVLWDCVDLSRSFANGGGALMTFEGDRVHALYYHDTRPDLLEWGEGERLGGAPPSEGTYLGRVPYHPEVPSPPEGGFVIRGTVVTPDGYPLEGSRVQMKGVEASAVLTGPGGQFALRAGSFENVLRVTAGRPGWYNGQITLFAGIDDPSQPIRITLEPVPPGDHESYTWVAPDPVAEPAEVEELFACGNCHKRQFAGWETSRHAQAAVNPLVLADYRGGLRAALADGTATVTEDDADCGACHSPSAFSRAVTRSSWDRPQGADARGNHCDFCHKIRHIERPDANGLSGSLVLGRPGPADPTRPGPVQRVFGSLSDVTYRFMGASLAPAFRTSWLCAGCHQSAANQAGIVKMNTFEEWRASVSLDPESRSCQDCHMPPDPDPGEDDLAIWAMDRGPDQLRDHAFRGINGAWVAEAIRIDGHAGRDASDIRVRIEVENIGANHRVPTGHPDKQLLLVISPVDAQGRVVADVPFDGPTLAKAPAIAGILSRSGRAPGAVFERRLAREGSDEPVAWWRSTREAWDTRLALGVPVEKTFRFDAHREIRGFEVRLVHRRRP